jgi:hypothetical protein
MENKTTVKCLDAVLKTVVNDSEMVEKYYEYIEQSSENIAKSFDRRRHEKMLHYTSEFMRREESMPKHIYICAMILYRNYERLPLPGKFLDRLRSVYSQFVLHHQMISNTTTPLLVEIRDGAKKYYSMLMLEEKESIFVVGNEAYYIDNEVLGENKG